MFLFWINFGNNLYKTVWAKALSPKNVQSAKFEYWKINSIMLKTWQRLSIIDFQSMSFGASSVSIVLLLRKRTHSQVSENFFLKVKSSKVHATHLKTGCNSHSAIFLAYSFFLITLSIMYYIVTYYSLAIDVYNSEWWKRRWWDGNHHQHQVTGFSLDLSGSNNHEESITMVSNPIWKSIWNPCTINLCEGPSI